MGTKRGEHRWSVVTAVSCECDSADCARVRAQVEACRRAILAAQEAIFDEGLRPQSNAPEQQSAGSAG